MVETYCKSAGMDCGVWCYMVVKRGLYERIKIKNWKLLACGSGKEC